jgi:hypothetical protein
MDAPVLISGLPHFSRTKPSVKASRPPQPAYCIHTAGDCFQVFARLVYGLAREVCAIAMRIEALTGYSSLEPPVGSSGITSRLCDLAHLSGRWRLQVKRVLRFLRARLTCHR